MIFMAFVFLCLGFYSITLGGITVALFCFSMVFFIRYGMKELGKRHSEYLADSRNARSAQPESTLEALERAQATGSASEI